MSKVLHSLQMCQYLEEGYVGICSCTEDKEFCLEGVLLGQLSVLLVEVLGSISPVSNGLWKWFSGELSRMCTIGTPVKIL